VLVRRTADRRRPSRMNRRFPGRQGPHPPQDIDRAKVFVQDDTRRPCSCSITTRATATRSRSHRTRTCHSASPPHVAASRPQSKG
jgi:hypothetical protein